MRTILPKPGLIHALLFCAGTTTPASVQALSETHALRAGAFVWSNEADASGGSLSITVNIARQRLYLYRGSLLIAMSSVSTGMRGHLTPLGAFTVLEKDRWHRSNIYSNAPMPYMQRLTWGGIALHGGHLPGYPASHGCIRLPHAFARALFAITTIGVPVTIVGGGSRQPLVKLQFADIDWLTDDEDVTIPAPPSFRAIPGEQASPRPSRSHWAPAEEREAAMAGQRGPILDFAPFPD